MLLSRYSRICLKPNTTGYSDMIIYLAYPEERLVQHFAGGHMYWEYLGTCPECGIKDWVQYGFTDATCYYCACIGYHEDA